MSVQNKRKLLATTRAPTTIITTKTNRRKPAGRKVSSCPIGQITAAWSIPKYKRIVAMATDNNKLYLVTDTGQVRYSGVKLDKFLARVFPEGGPIDAAVTSTLGKSRKEYQIIFSGQK